MALLEISQKELNKVKNSDLPSKSIFPKLSKHWQEINAGRRSDDEDEHEPGSFQVSILSLRLTTKVLGNRHHTYTVVNRHNMCRHLCF